MIVAALFSLVMAQTGSVVKLVHNANGYELVRNGKPFFIKGAGGDGSRQMLIECGANSIRTWGAENLKTILDRAEHDGIAVTVGIWLQHADVYDYHNPDLVAKQFKMCEDVVKEFKNHPAVLMWAFGNEMEFGGEEDPALWKAVNDIAAMSKRLDPNHPTMTVTAEIGGQKAPNFIKYCKDVDILGINSYAGAPSVAERYRKAGGTKPYVLTEFGTPGPWESAKTSWQAPVELSSTAKAERYRDSYERAVSSQAGMCLGSYAFVWGHKQEGTSTWFGMFLPDGKRTAAIDTMAEIWGRKRSNLCPRIEEMSVDRKQVKPGDTITANLSCSDPESDPLTVKWVLMGEGVKKTQGANEDRPTTYPESIASSGKAGATIVMPKEPGQYRLFVFVDDGKGGGATANIPLLGGS